MTEIENRNVLITLKKKTMGICLHYLSEHNVIGWVGAMLKVHCWSQEHRVEYER